MKTQHITPKFKTHRGFVSIPVGRALLGAASVALADDLIVNTFDFGLSGIGWENWRSYATGHSEVWDPSQDADGNSSSGSMYITVNWPLNNDPNWNNGWND